MTSGLGHRDDVGMATAEYAVGTVGATCIGCILLRLAGDGTIVDFLEGILGQIRAIVDSLGTAPLLPKFPLITLP